MPDTDILIIGAGITGTALARELSRYHASVLVLEKSFDVAEGASKANSGIVHAGYDAVPGTKKAYHNTRGAAMYPALCKKLAIPYKQCGSLVLAFSNEDCHVLDTLLERGKANGVPSLRLLDRPELLSLEPNLNPSVLRALDIPTGAIISPYEAVFAFADDAALNGVSFSFNEEVHRLSFSQGLWKVYTSSRELTCRVIVNCAGSFGADLHNQISDIPLQMVHRRGEYYLLDRLPVLPFSRTIFQCPSSMGKGVLISPTVHGNLIIGPTAEDIPDPMDTATTAEGLSQVLEKARITWPSLSVRQNITNFSGIRAHLSTDDFVIGPVAGCINAFEAIGIESPGLSSAPSIAQDLSEKIAALLSLEKKSRIAPYVRPSKPFHEMNNEERADAVNGNPLFGNIICRCETVTEAEIRAAIRRPVGARTIDGVKRRTRAGMGRCQGGFCLPRVAEILAEELGISVQDVMKSSSGSPLLLGTVESFLKGGSGHEV